MTQEVAAAVKNTGKTRYNSSSQDYKVLIELKRRRNARGYFISR
jgi:hypothetical protein